MKNLEKSYTRTIDAIRILSVFTFSLLIGVGLSKIGVNWPICFGIMILTGVVLYALTELIMNTKFSAQYMLASAAWFFWLSIAFDIAVVLYLAWNREFACLAVLVAVYLFLFIWKRKSRKEEI